MASAIFRSEIISEQKKQCIKIGDFKYKFLPIILYLFLPIHPLGENWKAMGPIHCKN